MSESTDFDNTTVTYTLNEPRLPGSRCQQGVESVILKVGEYMAVNTKVLTVPAGPGRKNSLIRMTLRPFLGWRFSRSFFAVQPLDHEDTDNGMFWTFQEPGGKLYSGVQFVPYMSRLTTLRERQRMSDLRVGLWANEPAFNEPFTMDNLIREQFGDNPFAE